MKTNKYGIPCAHLFVGAEVKKINLIEFIVNNTSRRWLLIENWEVSNKDILKRLENEESLIK